MAEVFYFTDAALTGRLEALTGTAIAASGDRDALVRRPAKAWADSVTPNLSPFAGITDAPPTPPLIELAALEFGVHLAHKIVSKKPDDAAAKAALDTAKMLLNIDDKTGLARAFISGSEDRPGGLGVSDITRSREAEARDEDLNQRALYP